jgi:glucosamine--fructose-6-phosphate aminotransferase (isomerizing)
MTEYRNAHPYAMHDAIHAQPDRVARVLESQRETIDRAAAAAAARQRILFLGIGTSYHAALLGEHFLRHLTAGRARAQADTSFQFVHYPLAVGPGDAVVVVSHRGYKNYSVQAVERARAAGALTLAFTGEGGSEKIRVADFVIPTCEQENSFDHTKSYTTALAALARFSIGVAEKQGHTSGAAAARAALDEVPRLMREALRTEAAAREAANRIAQRHQFVFLGAGPNWVTAMEAVVKVLETSYVPCSGCETEQFLHGPFSQVDARAAAVAIMAGGPADQRMSSVLEALCALGVARVVVATAGAGVGTAAPAEQRIEVPAVPEWLSPLVLVVPLQLICYYVALDRGTNPDRSRQNEPDHERAQKMFVL